MQNDEELSGRQSISLIKEMMEVSSKNLKKDGLLILVWGAVIVLVRFLTFFPEVKLISQSIMQVFDVLSWTLGIGAVVFTIYYVFINRKRTKTYIAITARYTWFGIIVLYNLIVILIKQKTGEIDFELLHPMQMSLIGMALFITGGLYREKLLLLGGIVYWVAAYFAVRYVLHIQFVFECMAGFIGFVIPGAWLYYQSRKNV